MAYWGLPWRLPCSAPIGFASQTLRFLLLTWNWGPSQTGSPAACSPCMQAEEERDRFLADKAAVEAAAADNERIRAAAEAAKHAQAAAERQQHAAEAARAAAEAAAAAAATAQQQAEAAAAAAEGKAADAEARAEQVAGQLASLQAEAAGLQEERDSLQASQGSPRLCAARHAPFPAIWLLLRETFAWPPGSSCRSVAQMQVGSLGQAPCAGLRASGRALA